MTKKMSKKKARITRRIGHIRKVKLTPVDKLERGIYELYETDEVQDETNEKVIEYAVDLQYGLKSDFRKLIEEIQETARLPIPEERKFEIAETSLSLLVANVCLAERLLASR